MLYMLKLVALLCIIQRSDSVHSVVSTKSTVMESENPRFPKCVPVVHVAVIKRHDSSEILSKVFSNVHITLEC